MRILSVAGYSITHDAKSSCPNILPPPLQSLSGITAIYALRGTREARPTLEQRARPFHWEQCCPHQEDDSSSSGCKALQVPLRAGDPPTTSAVTPSSVHQSAPLSVHQSAPLSVHQSAPLSVSPTIRHVSAWSTCLADFEIPAHAVPASGAVGFPCGVLRTCCAADTATCETFGCTRHAAHPLVSRYRVKGRSCRVLDILKQLDQFEAQLHFRSSSLINIAASRIANRS